MNNNEVFDRLNQSLNVLEGAIENAINSMQAKGGEIAGDVVVRITSYYELISKQRNLASEIQQAVSESNWELVAHKVKLVNGLLELIRDDAKAIIKGIQGGEVIGSEDDDEPMIIC